MVEQLPFGGSVSLNQVKVSAANAQGATSGSAANASSFSALGIDYESRESSTVHSHPRKEL